MEGFTASASVEDVPVGTKLRAHCAPRQVCVDLMLQRLCTLSVCPAQGRIATAEASISTLFLL